MQKTLQGKSFQTVLDVLRKEKDVPMSKIAQQTGLSIPTVKKVLDFCVANSMVTISDSSLATGGRKAQLFNINSKASYRLFVVAQGSSVHYRCVDFAGQICKNEQKEIITANFVSEVTQIFSNLKNEFGKIELCSICVPAYTANGKVVSWAGNESLNGIDLAKELSEKFSSEVQLNRSLSLAAYAYGDDTAAVQYTSNSVSIAQVINSHLLVGKGAMAGNTSLFAEGIVLNFSKYFAKVINSLVTVTAPEKVIFYGVKKDGFVEKVMREAMKKVPSEVQPEWIESSEFVEDVFKGMFRKAECQIA